MGTSFAPIINSLIVCHMRTTSYGFCRRMWISIAPQFLFSLQIWCVRVWIFSAFRMDLDIFVIVCYALLSHGCHMNLCRLMKYFIFFRSSSIRFSHGLFYIEISLFWLQWQKKKIYIIRTHRHRSKQNMNWKRFSVGEPKLNIVEAETMSQYGCGVMHAAIIFFHFFRPDSTLLYARNIAWCTKWMRNKSFCRMSGVQRAYQNRPCR